MTALFYPEDDTQKKALIAWTVEALPMRVHIPVDQAAPVGITSDAQDRLYAVAIFHNWYPDQGLLELTAAARAHPIYWAKPDILRELLGYVFHTVRARKLVCHIHATNHRAERFARGMHMTAEATLRHHFAHGQHARVWSMLDREFQRLKWQRKEAA